MQALKKAALFIKDNFYCPETGLIYDFRVEGEGNAWHHLPTPADIAKNNPNPCGWGTGMEDSVLNNGSALDALIAHFERTGDRSLKAPVDALFAGLMRCVNTESGFVARSVSPVDGKSHYINSSRDQYTHWVYAAVRLYDSALCDGHQREQIRAALSAIACKCEREVTKENGYELLREDGKAGLVCKMWGEISPHEYLRLPMFYLAAHHVTGEARWQQSAHLYLREGLEKTADFDIDRSKCYVSLQLQYSLRLIFDLCEDSLVKEAAKKLMERLANHWQAKVLDTYKSLCTNGLNPDFNFIYHPWNRVEMRDMGVVNGLIYLNPAQSEDKNNRAFYPIRNIGEAVSVAALCPNFSIDPRLPEILENVAASIDYTRHCTYAPLLLVCGYLLVNAAQKNY